MKKLSLIMLIMILAVAIFVPCGVVFASDTQYYYINPDASGDVILYSDAACSAEYFKLNKTYYVQIISKESTASKVKNGDIEGYIKSSDEGKLIKSKYLSGDGRPYYFSSARQTAVSDITIYSDINIANKAGNNAGKDVIFMGFASTGNLAILIDKSVRYMENGAITNTTIDQSGVAPNPINDTAPPLGGGDTTKEPTNNLVKTLLIVAICILSVLIVFLIFKPVKKKNDRFSMSEKRGKQDDYYDDYDKDYR